MECYPPQSYEYLVNLADIYLANGKTQKAIEYLMTAHKKNPDKIEVNNSLGIIYLGDYGLEFLDAKKALPYNLKAFEVNQDRTTEDVLGRNYYELGDYQNAEKHYQKLQNEYPDFLTYQLNLGIIKYKQNKRNEAEVLFQNIIQSDSSMKSTIEEFKKENE